MNILNGSGLKLAEYGATVTIGQDADDKSRMVLGATSLDLIVDDGGTDTNFASFGAVTRIGDVANEHISMSSAGMTIKDGGDVIGKFVAGGATLGKTAGAHISASTLDVHIIKDSDNKAVLDSDSFDIVLNGATSASFGATTTIGSAIGQHVKITNDAFEIKTDANTTVLSASSAGLEMQGTVRADAGELAGFTIGPLDRNQPPRVLSTNEDSSTSGSSLYTSVLHNLSSATSSILISPAVQAPFGLSLIHI